MRPSSPASPPVMTTSVAVWSRDSRTVDERAIRPPADLELVRPPGQVVQRDPVLGSERDDPTDLSG